MLIRDVFLAIILGYMAVGLVFSLPAELEYTYAAFAQSNIDKQITKNNLLSVNIQCFERPCSAEPDGTTNVTNNENSTALIGISFKDVPLEEIQENNETLKAIAGSYLNATIDALAAGNLVTQTRCFPLDIYDSSPQAGGSCPIIDGIVTPSPNEETGP